MMRGRAMVLVLLLSGAAAFPQETSSATFEREVGPFFKSHCVRCHNPEKKKGKFVLDSFGGTIAAPRSGYASTREGRRPGDFPPEEEPQPAVATVRRIADWIQKGLKGAATPSS